MKGVAVMIVVAVVLAAAAPVSATTELSKKEFARRGNAICSSYYRNLNAMAQPKTRAELASYLRKQLRYGNAETLKLSKLAPPPTYARRFQKMLAVARTEARKFPALIRAVEANNQRRVETIFASLVNLDKKYNAYANSIGLNVCGQPTSTG